MQVVTPLLPFVVKRPGPRMKNSNLWTCQDSTGTRYDRCLQYECIGPHPITCPQMIQLAASAFKAIIGYGKFYHCSGTTGGT
jgi:hypothetical protein